MSASSPAPARPNMTLFIAVDIVLVVVAFFLAHIVRNIVAADHPDMVQVKLSEYTGWDWKMVILVLILLTLAVQKFNGLYNPAKLRASLFWLVRTVAISCIQVAGGLMILIYLFWQGNIFSRAALALFTVLLFVLLTIKTVVLRRAG